MGLNPSYSWRGIWDAKRFLIKGSNWRIGDGTSAKVRKDPWVPGFHNMSHLTNVDIEGMRGAKMSSFLENNQNIWDISKVRAMFNPMVATEILKIMI